MSCPGPLLPEFLLADIPFKILYCRPGLNFKLFEEKFVQVVLKGVLCSEKILCIVLWLGPLTSLVLASLLCHSDCYCSLKMFGPARTVC